MSNDEARSRFIVEMSRHDRRIRGYLFTLLACQNAVDEVMQETALALWEKIDDYDPARPFFPWACQFAYFKVLEWRKHNRQDRLTFHQELLEQISASAVEAHQPDRDRHSALQVCLSRLDPRDRELLRQRYEQNHRVVDLANVSGKPAKYFYNRIDRLRLKLASCIRHRLAETT